MYLNTSSNNTSISQFSLNFASLGYSPSDLASFPPSPKVSTDWKITQAVLGFGGWLVPIWTSGSLPACDDTWLFWPCLWQTDPATVSSFKKKEKQKNPVLIGDGFSDWWPDAGTSVWLERYPDASSFKWLSTRTPGNLSSQPLGIGVPQRQSQGTADSSQ